MRQTVLCLLLLAPTPTLALEAVESVFQVSYRYAGEDQVFNEMVVPLLPANACYNWYVRLDAPDEAAVAVERLTIPEAIDWGDMLTNTEDTFEISDDGKVVVNTFDPAPDDEGWFTGGWCVAEGDPTGLHTIEVSVGGTKLATWEFEVVAPSEYSWPAATQPDPRERSVDKSW